MSKYKMSSEQLNESRTEALSGRSEDYEEIDLTDNPLYQVLSAFFENEDGENLCAHLSKLTAAVEANTTMMAKLLSKQVKGKDKA